jgi:hypothetical protein
MKLLSIFFLVLITNATFASDETDKVGIITPLSYDRTPGKFQNSKSSTAIWLGDLVGKADVGEKIKASMEPFKKDLAKYFPKANELDSLLNNLIAEANRDIVKGDLNDAKTIQVNKFFGNKLLGNIADRILEVEGVKDSSRRKIWVDKILAPFNSCISKATNALYAADHCMEALKASMVPSAGVGIVYEVSREKLSSSFSGAEKDKFNQQQVEYYRECMPKTNASSNDVMNCAVSSMQKGVIKVTDLRLSKIINDAASSPANAKSIKASVWPDFNKCIGAVTAKSSKPIDVQMNDCIDTLTQNTGMAVVKDSILNNPSVKSYFSKKELEALAKDKSEQFKKCTEELIKNNVRKDGLIVTANCENIVKNDVTYKVMIRTFNDNAKDMLKTQPELISLVSTAGKNALDECWSESQSQAGKDSCIKSSVITFSKKIAAIKLDAAVPDTLRNKSQVVSTALESLKTCLEKSLPSNISESSNTNEKISECTDKLTRNIAATVADSEVRNTLKGKMPEAEINTLVEKLVKKEFATCLGNKPTDDIINKCSDALKVAVSEKVLDLNINQYMADRPGLDLSKKRAEIKSELIANLNTCLKSSKDKDSCTDVLQKDANKKIVLAFGRTEASVQLNTDQLPEKLKPVESQFIDCTKTDLKGDKLSLHLDECNKKFAIEFARTLGEVKLKYLLGKAIGSDELLKQQASLDDIVGKYNKCLDNLYQFKMEEGITEKIGVCTKELEGRALGLVKRNLNDWMSSEQKDAVSISVKDEFSSILPCLSALLPASPYDPKLQRNTESLLKPIAALVAGYIDYSPENARISLREIIAKLARDIKETGGTDKSKEGLLDLLYQNGALDQFIKSMVRGKVKDAFSTLSEKDLPRKVRDQLITKENFDDIFNTPEGKAIKDYVHNTILKPMLIDGADMKSPAVNESLEQVNNKVVKMLVASPKFGDVIVKSGVQQQIDDMNGFTKFFAKVLYGKDSLNWEKVRLSENGIKAEAYIKEHILMPKFAGTVVSPEDEKRYSAEAEKLVSEAVKKY